MWRGVAGAVGIAAIITASAAQADERTAAPKSIWEQETLTGDWGGARTALKEKSGIDISLTYINEVLDVLNGGINRRASYEGRLDLSVDTDLGKLIGFDGAVTHVTVYQIHGSRNNAAANVGSIADPSNIDAVRTTRLFTAWFQYGDPAYNKDDPSKSDRLSFRIGQLAADDEFLTGPTAGGLINGTFGWAAIHAANMLSGGPAYPLATPGARVQVRPIPELALRAAVFSGDPASANCNGNPQICNLHGTTFRLAGGALFIAEAEYGLNQAKKALGLPGVYKIGAWRATADYADQHFGVTAGGGPVSLASPAAIGPLNHSGNWEVYGVADQMIWRNKDTSLNLFVRAGAVPSDRNLVSAYVDGGAGFKGLLPGRADDTLTFGAAYIKISPDGVALDRDTNALTPPYPLRNQEVVFEVSYAAQIAPWWTIQPDFQYIVHPGGNVLNPNNLAATIKNAAIVGVRSTIKF
jgi:porin